MNGTDLLQHYRRQRRWTLLLVDAIPPDRFDWAPHADTFRLGDLVRHLMQAEVFWRKLMEHAARGEDWDPFGLPGPPRERIAAFAPRNLEVSRSDKYGADLEACRSRWASIQADTEAALAAVAADQWERDIHHPLTGLVVPLWEAVLVMLAHEGHHRGQLSAYLKQLGAPQPPLFAAPDVTP
jgi:uncharacterized damage-inducible protein DinB